MSNYTAPTIDPFPTATPPRHDYRFTARVALACPASGRKEGQRTHPPRPDFPQRQGTILALGCLLPQTRVGMKAAALNLILLLLVAACSQEAQRTVVATGGTPQFAIAPADVSTTWVSVVTGRIPSSPTQETAILQLRLSGTKAAQFRDFTRAHVNHRIQVMVGTNIVEEPVIRAEIPGPNLELLFPSAKDAQAIASFLSKK